MNRNLNPSLSGTDSFHGFEAWRTREMDVKKKRKVVIEELSLPNPKLPRGGPNKNHSQEEDEQNQINILPKMGMEVELELLQDHKGKKLDELQIGYGHEEDLLEFGSHENLLFPKHSNHGLVSSSARWTIEPSEAESKTVKPTIDEEFEDYFSELLPSFHP